MPPSEHETAYAAALVLGEAGSGAGTGAVTPMHTEPIPRTSLSAADSDAVIQSAVLTHLLDLAPAHLTPDEIVRELANEPRGSSERDEVQRAIRDLNRAGPLHRHDDFVLPTRAAIQHGALPRT